MGRFLKRRGEATACGSVGDGGIWEFGSAGRREMHGGVLDAVAARWRLIVIKK